MSSSHYLITLLSVTRWNKKFHRVFATITTNANDPETINTIIIKLNTDLTDYVVTHSINKWATGIIERPSQHILSSIDGDLIEFDGQKFKVQRTTNSLPLNAIKSINNDEYVAAGDAGIILESVKKAKKIVQTSTKKDLYTLSTSPSHHILTAGIDGTVLLKKSKTWTKLKIKQNKAIFASAFYADNEFFLAGDNYLCRITLVGKKTNEFNIKFLNDFIIYDIHYESEKLYVAAGEQGFWAYHLKSKKWKKISNEHIFSLQFDQHFKAAMGNNTLLLLTQKKWTKLKFDFE